MVKQGSRSRFTKNIKVVSQISISRFIEKGDHLSNEPEADIDVYRRDLRNADAGEDLGRAREVWSDTLSK